MNNIDRLLELNDIKNLRIKYTHLFDTNSINELGELFAENAVCDVGQGVWQGREEIRQGLAKAFAEYDVDKRGSYPFLHAITNQWVEFTGEDTAQGRCYLIDLHTIEKPVKDPWILLGTYADAYQCIDGRWYITHSRLDIAWPSRRVVNGLPGEGMGLFEETDNER
jgi:hypothetical protein